MKENAYLCRRIACHQYNMNMNNADFWASVRGIIAEGLLTHNQAKPDLCRTQQVIQLSDKSQTAYFLTNPIGNHHIIMPGYHRDLITALLHSLGFTIL